MPQPIQGAGGVQAPQIPPSRSLPVPVVPFNDDPSRPGASDRVDPATYFRILDALARRLREGKASLDKEAPSIFDRLTLTTNGVLFWETIKKLERMTLKGAFVRALGSPEELKKAADKVNPDKTKRSWFVVNKKVLRPDTDAS